MQKAVLLLIVWTFSLFGEDPQYNRGEMLYFTKGCNGCHGPSAEGGGNVPRLAQQGQNILINRLDFFRSGNVSSQTQEMMVQFTLKLSDKEIEDLSYFFHNHHIDTKEEVSSELLGGFGS